MIQFLKEHWQYRKQILVLAKTDIVKTYRGAALGWAWAIIQPAFTIFTYWFAFSIGLKAGGPIAGYPYVLWLIAGIIPWFFMRDNISSGTQTINKYKYLATKLQYPVSIFGTFYSLSRLTINIILVGIVTAIYIGYGFTPDVYFIQIPFYYLLAFIFFTCWGIFVSELSVINKDFGNLVRSTTLGIFWLSGILWDVSNIDNIALQKFLKVNPVTYITNGFRNVFIYKKWFFEDMFSFYIFLGVTACMIILMLFTHKKIHKDIYDLL